MYVPSPSFLSTQHLFYMEKETADFFNKKMIESSVFGKRNLYLTMFDIQNQSINPDLVQSKFDAVLTILYEGKEKSDLSSSLSATVTNSEAEKLLQTLVDNGLFGKSSTSSLLEYKTVDTKIVASSLGRSKNLFIALLCLVSMLLLTSFGIIISSTIKCRNRRRDESNAELQQTGIKQSSTMETTENSPSSTPAKLGARKHVIPVSDDSAYAITPVRRGCNSQVSQTPMGKDSSISDLISPASSTSSRNPLGIMRLSTLNKVSHQPQIETAHPTTMYKIPLHESCSDDEESNVGNA